MAMPEVALYAVKLRKTCWRFEYKLFRGRQLYSNEQAGSSRAEIEKAQHFVTSVTAGRSATGASGKNK
jgi:hypothetical protein